MFEEKLWGMGESRRAQKPAGARDASLLLYPVCTPGKEKHHRFSFPTSALMRVWTNIHLRACARTTTCSAGLGESYWAARAGLPKPLQ